MQSTKTRLGISAYAVLVFMLLLGANGVRSLVGWPGYLVLCAAGVVTAVVLFVRFRSDNFAWHRLPKPLIAFILLCGLSIIWSNYHLETLGGFTVQLATTVVAVSLATVLTWHELLRTLGTALRYLIGLSLVFELFVELVFGHPIFQGFVAVPEGEKVSKLLYWSRALLFEGGPVQGLVANSTMFGFLALLGLIVFAVQLRGGLVRPVQGWFWVLVALGSIALTRSATVAVALAVVVVTALFTLWARKASARRGPVYLVGALLLAATAAVAVFGRGLVFGLLGKSADLTGRGETWSKVIELAQQRPVAGWGWVSYWVPWVEPFKGLDTKAGLPVMHAHNAWLDVWLQLGWIGVVIFALLILMTLQRVWCRAIDQPRRGVGAPLPYATSATFPLLIFVALLTQSLTESRILSEGLWLILVIFAVKCRIDFVLPSRADEPVRVPWRRVPIAQTREAQAGGGAANLPEAE